MLKKPIIYCLLYMVNFILNQDINYELACTNIKYTSKKDCTVAPWYENMRCCYISYDSGSGRTGQCIFVNDTKKALKEKKNEFGNSGKKKVKIECDSKYLFIYILTFILLFFIFF